MQVILSRYADLPGDRDLAFRTLCALLAENPAGVDWSGFGPLEWELLGAIAVGEGVAPLAYTLLRTQPEAYHRSAVDPLIYQALAESEAVTALRNALLFRQLERILRLLGETNLPVVLLKGADLAHSLYPQPGLRSMTDLDLWVLQAHFDQALVQVKALGYREDIPEASPGFDRLLSHHVHLRKTGRNATQLELHWTLVAPPAYRHAAPTDWFWANREPSQRWNEKIHPGASDTVFHLNPTANLLYLAAHQMLQHGGGELSLRWLLDLQRLVERWRGDIDWQALVKQAGLFGWCGALWAALDALQTCFATHLPDGLLTSLQAGAGPDELRLAQMSTSSPTRTLSAWKEFNALGWAGRWRLLVTRFFPRRDYVRWRYPPRPAWLWPLSYLHLWRYIARDGWRTLQSILRSLFSWT